MKKVLALALALVMALSMSAMAFAQEAEAETTTKAAFSAECPYCKVVFNEAGPYNTHLGICPSKPVASANINTCPHCGATFAEEAQYNAHLKVCAIKTCPKCKEVFGDEAAYNDHVQNCTVGDTKDYINLDVKTILDMIIDLVKSSLTQWGDIESVVVRLVDFIENMGNLGASKVEVLGAVDELEASLADVKIPGLDELLNTLKAKIKAMYAGEKATTVEETTAADKPADTGSSAAGIAAFAAISVAAAAAYVCTKKSK